MFMQNILVLGFAAFAVAEPAPMPAIPTDPAGLSSYLASYSRLESVLSGMPTLPASVQSVLLTAAPTSLGTDCETTTPAWINSLPSDVKSAFISYESAIASWYKIHASELGITTTLANYGICTGGATAAATGTAKTATSTGSVTATGTGSAAASGTSAGTAASTSAKAAGAQATAAIGAGLAGVVGILGVMAVL